MLDQLISTNITSIQSSNLTKIMLIITNFGGKYLITFFSIILLTFLLQKKLYIKTKIFILTMVSSLIFSLALKYIIQRPRPLNMLIEKTTFSFPSGHSTLSIAFFGMMIYLFKNKIKNKTSRYLFITSNIAIILMVGFSRIYLNVHWMSDVIGGYVLGLISIISSIYIINKINPKPL